MSEFCHTPVWEELENAVSCDSLPLGLIIYFDKFGILRSKNAATGQRVQGCILSLTCTGGLYFTLTNFDASMRADPRNLFLLSLAPKDIPFDSIASVLAAELVQLSKGNGSC